MRIALDATPLLGARTGIGRYVAGLVDGLAGLAGLPCPPAPVELTLAAFTFRGARDIVAPAGVRVAGRRFPARLLQQCWLHGPLPPAEWLTGDADVVHGTNFVCPPRRRAAGVVTIHDLTYLHAGELVSPASLRYRRLVPRALDAGALVLTPSRAVAGQVRDAYGLPADRVTAVAHGIDPAWSAAAPPGAGWLAARGLPPRYLVAVGSLEPRKDLARLITAHERLTAADPSAPPLVLVGPAGWGEPLHTGPGVHLTGWLDDADLRRVVAGAALLAFPSRDEGFGLPPLEALACGVPVVVSDLPVLREVLGEHAVYVPPAGADPDSGAGTLAAALAGVLAAGGPTGAAARRAHAAGFTWQRCAQETLAVYRRAAGV